MFLSRLFTYIGDVELRGTNNASHLLSRAIYLPTLTVQLLTGVRLDFICQLGYAHIPRYFGLDVAVKVSFFHVRLPFTSVDFHKSKSLSIMWVSLTQSVEGLKKKTGPSEKMDFCQQTPSGLELQHQQFPGSPACWPAHFGLTSPPSLSFSSLENPD